MEPLEARWDGGEPIDAAKVPNHAILIRGKNFLKVRDELLFDFGKGVVVAWVQDKFVTQMDLIVSITPYLGSFDQIQQGNTVEGTTFWAIEVVTGGLGRGLIISGMVTSRAMQTVDRIAEIRLSGTKFRGNLRAFGVGSRSDRAWAMVEMAALASKVRLSDIVDEVRYVQGSSFFEVDLAGNGPLCQSVPPTESPISTHSPSNEVIRASQRVEL